MNDLVEIHNEEDRRIAFEQYKTVVESLNKINEIRETSNNFWTGLNGALISSIAYIKDMQTIGQQPKQLFFWTAILLGIFMALTWVNYLTTLKKSVDVRNDMLIEFERYFPGKPFTFAINTLGRREGRGSLSFKEMRIPLLFLLGYVFFAITLLLYPNFLLP